MSDRRLIVGLGNPGRQYRETRHNVGFMVIERLLQRHPPQRSWRKFEAELFEVRTSGGPEGLGLNWLLMQPQTYMNLSGQSVAGAVGWYDLPLDDLVVVSDDLNLPLGRLRFRRQGSHGGQKGLADIIARLGTNEFPRLRIGIESPRGDAIGHVLGTFAPDERPVIDEAVERACDAVELWARAGIEEAMNIYNAA